MRLLLVLTLSALCLQLGTSAHALEDIIDSPMYRLPPLPAPPVDLVFSSRMKELWLRALKRPEVDMKLKAAETIALARQRGMKEREPFVAPLLAELNRADQVDTVRLAIARALIAVDARQAAADLFRQAETGTTELRQVIEPALARWNYLPARAMWLERLRQSRSEAPRSLLLAIECLGVVGEPQALPQLRAMVRDERVSAPLRREAARALPMLAADGLEMDADQLSAEAGPHGSVSRWAAAALLRRHRSPGALAILRRLAIDAEPAIAVLAGTRLLEIDAQLIGPYVAQYLGSEDPGLRSLGVDILQRLPSADHIHLLAERLNDVHPDVRTRARQHLLELAQKDGSIRAEGMRVLATGTWQGLEQAAILLAQLEHKPAWQRLAQLLAHERREVFVTAAWALRKLAEPLSLPMVHDFVAAKVKFRLSGKPPPDLARDWTDHQLAQLNQLLGQLRYRPAARLLRTFVPKGIALGGESRAAALWALGFIHENKAPPDLATELLERLNDVAGVPPEDARVRWMAAIALGRMKAANMLAGLKKLFDPPMPTEDPVHTACGWAIQQITGEPMRAAQPIQRSRRDWFLVPND